MRDKGFKFLLQVAVIVTATESIFSTCPKNTIIVKEPHHQCIPCASCPEGQEPSPQRCGSQITEQERLTIKFKCENCKPGHYSDEYDIYPCKECHNCLDNQIVVKKCSNTSDTICHKLCNKGYYYENSSLDCERCSCCCGDSKDVKIEKCISDGEPESNQCSSHWKQECCKATPQSTVASEQPTTKAVVKTPSTDKTIWIAVGVILTILFIVILLLIGINIWKYKRRRNNNTDSKKTSGRYKCKSTSSFKDNLTQKFSAVKGSDDKDSLVHKKRDVRLPKNKLFKLGDLNLVEREHIGKMLDHQADGVGSTKELATLYKMDNFKIEYLLKQRNPGEQFLKHVNAKFPRKTVYEFCEDLQLPGIERNDIVGKLCSYLDKDDQELSSSSKREKSNV